MALGQGRLFEEGIPFQATLVAVKSFEDLGGFDRHLLGNCGVFHDNVGGC